MSQPSSYGGRSRRWFAKRSPTELKRMLRHSTPDAIDYDDLVEALEAKLREERRRRRKIWITFILASAMLIGALAIIRFRSMLIS